MSENENLPWPLIWHMFDTDLSDEQVNEALEGIDVHIVQLEREKGLVWVDKDNSFTPEIQKVLKEWSKRNTKPPDD